MTRAIAPRLRLMPSTISISTLHSPKASSNTFPPLTHSKSFRTRIFAPLFPRKRPCKPHPMSFSSLANMTVPAKVQTARPAFGSSILKPVTPRRTYSLEATALNLGAVPVGGVDPKQAAQAASLPANLTPIYLIPVGHPKSVTARCRAESTLFGNSASYREPERTQRYGKTGNRPTEHTPAGSRRAHPPLLTAEKFGPCRPPICPR